MPRPLVFGNGRLLVQMDRRCRIRDLFWPLVSGPNHANGQTFRLGLFSEGCFTWTDGDSWEITQGYEPGALVGDSLLESASFPVSLRVRDAVATDRDVYVREIELRNKTASEVRVEMFFHQDLCIGQTQIGDTAFHHPQGPVVHYQGSYAFAFDGISSLGGIAQVVVGVKGFQGLQGTWKDAEDGLLHDKCIEQGSVDSTFSIQAIVAPNAHDTVTYWIACGETIEAAVGLSLETKISPGDVLATRSAVDQAWLSARSPDLTAFPLRLRELFSQSLLVVRSQIAENGAILAANDSEVLEHGRAHYSYVWPRDGALVAEMLDRVGDHETAAAYHRFALSLIQPNRPYFLQKYNADKTLGATWHPWVTEAGPVIPIQEDETALSLWSLARHLELAEDSQWVQSEYARTIRPMACFLRDYRDPETMLPLPSHDLWEERRGVHAFTCATVAAGLFAAAEFAKTTFDPAADTFEEAATEVRLALVEHLLKPGLRSLLTLPDGSVVADDTVDASLLLVPLFVELDRDLAKELMGRVEQKLRMSKGIGGIARYTGDWYHRHHEAFPGNPWVITTLWLAKLKLQLATSAEDLNDPLSLLEWVADRAETTGILAEQYDPVTGGPLSVSPLTWSHAEFAATCLDYLEAASKFGK